MKTSHPEPPEAAYYLSPTFLNTGTTDETFQQSRKQGSFRHILKSSACIVRAVILVAEDLRL